MTSPLRLSPHAVPQLRHTGREALPLLEIDGALADPDLVVEIAARHDFARHGPFYPGVRAPVSEAVAMPLVAPLADSLVETFGLGASPRYFECYLSVVTVPPGELAPIQRVPHFDGVEPGRLAVLLYLDRKERGGTAFYRQRATGFESVDAARYERYRAELEAQVARDGLPESAYIDGDTPAFQRVDRTEGRFNRMVIYRGNSLHCAALSHDFVPDPDPRSGRLTLNLFLAA